MSTSFETEPLLAHRGHMANDAEGLNAEERTSSGARQQVNPRMGLRRQLSSRVVSMIAIVSLSSSNSLYRAIRTHIQQGGHYWDGTLSFEWKLSGARRSSKSAHLLRAHRFHRLRDASAPRRDGHAVSCCRLIHRLLGAFFLAFIRLCTVVELLVQRRGFRCVRPYRCTACPAVLDHLASMGHFSRLPRLPARSQCGQRPFLWRNGCVPHVEQYESVLISAKSIYSRPLKLSLSSYSSSWAYSSTPA